MKRYVILVLVLLGVFKILSLRIIDIRVRKVCPIVATATEINSKEAKIFLRQWAEYVNRGYKEKVPENFSSDEVNMADRLPWIVRLWMEKKCIDPKRFFYTEQRFRSILKAHEMKRHTDGVIAILSMQMATEQDENKKAWYADLIEKQRQLAKIEGITDAEIEMTKDREHEIRELLK